MMNKDTLDGMSVEQLRDLAKRAEAAAKVQEEKAKITCGMVSVRVASGEDPVVWYDSGKCKSVVGGWTVNRLLAEAHRPEQSDVVDLLVKYRDSRKGR